jgi:hypothetical protein
MTAQKLRLDYFNIYDVVNREVNFAVQARGQFDAKLVKMQLSVLDFFANPVSKNGEPMYDKRAHLAWYRGPVPAEPTRRVVLENQFGKIQVWIGGSAGLLAPTHKVEPGSAAPEKLDHYKVYRVIDWGQTPQANLKLKDQFGSGEAQLLKPAFFAVPVRRVYKEKKFPIVNEKAHLLIFNVTPKDLQTKIKLSNQFEKSTATVVRRLMLAVPSVKLEWK